MATIGVTGAAGQLGQEFSLLSQYYPKHGFVFFDSEELDITNWDKLDDELEEYDLDFMINCAAYTKVDQAETDSELAYSVNRDGAANLAKYCDQNDIVFIHFSTDYVYHNDLRRPLKEDDPTEPKGVYAASKLAGEVEILRQCENSIIFRTSWVFSSFGSNFVKNILNATSGKKEFNVVDDQLGTPTYARDLADRVLKIVDGIASRTYDIHDVHGIYNISNAGSTNWYEFTKTIFGLEELDCVVHPVSSADYVTPVQRPPYSVFDQSKFNAEFGMEMPVWQDSLVKCLRALKEN